jgi:[ribosomal protein S18]-alanine N-acetyltransferase
LQPEPSRVEVARPTMQVRTMQPSEATFVDALAAETGFHLDIDAELRRGFARIWVASVESASRCPDAFLLAWIAADELHIIAVGTRPDQRRTGLARRLVATMLEFAKTTRTRLVILEVRRSNRAALALYRGFGFSVSRLRRGYYADPEEDGIEMQLSHDEHGCVVPLPDEVPWLEVSECLR